MKIAVISDIHANPLTFDKVMDDIKIFNPDKIFCLGDLILAGYNPNYICEKILELKNKMGDDFVIIQGNTDKMVAFCNDEIIQNTIKAFPCMGYSLKEDVKITKKEYVDFVRNLPEKQILVLNGLKVELCHGSPRNQSENIYPELMPETVEEMVKNSLACGYSLSSNKTIINVGSVGRSMSKDKMPVYLQLTIDKNGKFFSEHRIIQYDNIQASRHILARGFECCEDLAKMYIV